MPAMPIDEVQSKLPELIHSLAPDAQLIITEGDLPVARLTPAVSPLPRKLGTMRGTVAFMADDFDAPLDVFREYSE